MTTFFMWAALALTALFSNAQAAEVTQPMLKGVVYKGDAKVGEFNAPLVKDLPFQMKVIQVNGVQVTPEDFVRDPHDSILGNGIRAEALSKTGSNSTQTLRINYATWMIESEKESVKLGYSIRLNEDYEDSNTMAPAGQAQINPLEASFELEGSAVLGFGKSIDFQTGVCSKPLHTPDGCYRVVLNLGKKQSEK